MDAAYKKNLVSILFVLAIFSFSCKKYLDARSDKSLVIPRSITDIQSLLDNEIMVAEFPLAGEWASDNYYFFDDYYNSISSIDDRKNYIWDGTCERRDDYFYSYSRIFNCNAALEALKTVRSTGSKQEYDNAQGYALFYRAFNFYELSQLYAYPYSSDSKNLPYGIPLKLSPDIESPTTRSTVQETYEQIINDLKSSVPLLPAEIIFKTRPSKASAYALLARVYLVMADYTSSGKYADSCLQLTNELIDYASIPPPGSLTIPFKRLNTEVIFHASTRFVIEFLQAKVDSLLYKSYSDDDARKTLFYRSNSDGTYRFRGNYNGSSSFNLFAGIATDEVYLIRAECAARNGNKDSAMADLNRLLLKRWKDSGAFIPMMASSPTEAIEIVLQERRKELAFRAGLRWTDLRRLTHNDGSLLSLQRVIDGQSYILPPNDLRYTFLIPRSVIDMTDIRQNER